MKKGKLVKLLLLSSVLVLTGCNQNTPSETSSNSSEPTTSSVSEEVIPTSVEITLAGESNHVKVGETLQLNAKVNPENANQDVVWTSSNESIATVSETGLVTAAKEGNVFIYAASKKDNNIKGEIALIIEAADPVEVLPTEFTLTAPSTQVEINNTLNITLNVTPENAISDATWTSSDETVATVSNRGVVKGLKEGKVTITATSTKVSSVKGTIEIEVIPADLPEPTEDWDTIEFTTHDNYISCEDGTPLKVKGVVTALSSVSSKGLINYFIQNGNDGYYVYGQDAATFPVELGKVYEVGGFKKTHYAGGFEIVDVEHLVALDEQITSEVQDVSALDFSDKDAYKPYYGGLVKLDNVVVTEIPTSVKKSFNLNVSYNDKAFTIRFDNTFMSEEDFTAIGESISGLVVGQIINVKKAVMACYGYGTPAAQLQVNSPEDIEIAELSDEQKMEATINALSIKDCLDSSYATVDLPTSSDAFDGVSIAWESSNTDIIATDGTINHPERDTMVKLTATITINELSSTKEFDVTVLSADDSYFTVAHTFNLEDALPSSGYGDSDSKSSYQEGNVELGTPAATWMMRNALICGQSYDNFNGTFGIRIQAYDDSTPDDTGRVELRTDISFDAVELRISGYNNDPLGSYIHIAYSTDSGANFTDAASFQVVDKNLDLYRVILPETANRVSIYETSSNGRVRNNLDDIRLLTINK